MKAAADSMLAATGTFPERAERMLVELALYHFSTFGVNEQRTWGATQAEVLRLLAESEVGIDRPPTILDLSHAVDKTFGYPVAREANLFLNVGGSGNTIDLCTKPYPGPSGTADVLLGGSNNKGQVDLVGTIMVLAGDHNTWLVQDPSKRIDPQTDLQAYDQQMLAANAQDQKIILEGTAADWTVKVDAQNATYTNVATGTQVAIPASAQDQVSYATAEQIQATAT